AEVRPLEVLGRQGMRGFADRDPARRGRALQTRRRVEDVARREPFFGGSLRADADDRLAGLDADSNLQVEARLGELANDRKAGSKRARRVVLVDERRTEHSDDRVTDELLDGATVRLDSMPRQRVVAAHQTIDVFRVESLAQLCRTNDVAEQGGDDLPLDRPLRTLHGAILLSAPRR